jgi:hypothetical protein
MTAMFNDDDNALSADAGIKRGADRRLQGCRLRHAQKRVQRHRRRRRWR